MMLKRIFNSKLYILIALVHTLLTFLSDSIFFEYEMGLKFVLYKMALFMILTLFYGFIFHVISKLLDRDKRMIRNVKVFMIYFLIMFVLVIICYPGNIKHDEILIMKLVKTGGVDSWYHVFTYMLCTLSLMIIPYIGGISFVQSFICSLIFIYIYD